MKVYAEKIVDTMVDMICDVCEESVVIEGNYEETVTLSASFLYGSDQFGNVYHLDLFCLFFTSYASLQIHSLS